MNADGKKVEENRIKWIDRIESDMTITSINFEKQDIKIEV